MTGVARFNFKNNRIYFIVGFLVLLELANMLFVGSPLNLAIAFPEVIYVLFILFVKNDTKAALLYHVIFCLTGFDATFSDEEAVLYSYPEVKLFGPLTVSYIILGLIWVRAITIPINKEVKQTLLFKFWKIILILMLYGAIVGFLGILFDGYRFGDFITPFVYIFIGFVFLDIVIRLYDKQFLEECYGFAFCLLVASPIATFISFFLLHLSVEYSVYDTLISNEVFGFCPILMLFLVFKEKNNKLLLYTGLVTYFICAFTAGRGGTFLDIAACFAIIAYIVYTKKGLVRPIYRRLLIIGIPITVVGIVSYSQIMDVGANLATVKISELFSMFQALGTISSSGLDISGISESPYVRIAEVLNVLDNGLHNILGLLFGYGYGGYYTDSTHLFEAVPLTGAFPQEYINTGRYGTAHSFMPTLLLYNGVVGLTMTTVLCFRYLKSIKFTPLAFAAFNLFFHSFYFNTSIIMGAAFILFAAESRIVYQNRITEHKNENTIY